MVFFRAVGPREAVEILQMESHRWHHGFRLSVDLNAIRIAEQPWHLWLDRFVAALERNVQIREIAFIGGAFFDQDCYPHSSRRAGIKRLLGTVLPWHPSLTSITFSFCRLLPEDVELFASTHAAAHQKSQSVLRTLTLDKTPLDHQGAMAVANLLRVSKIEKVVLYGCDIDSSGCQAIFDAVKGNTHLSVLELRGNNISDISPEGVRALENSKVRILGLSNNPLTRQSLSTLALGLRTNSCLEHLRIFHRDIKNYRKLEVDSHKRLDHILQCNAQVQNVHQNLLSRNYYLPELFLWPQALAQISSKPTLLYRFMRDGNLDLFTADLMRVVVVVANEDKEADKQSPTHLPCACSSSSNRMARWLLLPAGTGSGEGTSSSAAPPRRSVRRLGCGCHDHHLSSFYYYS